MDIYVVVVFLESESRDAEVMEGSLCVSVLQSVVPGTTGEEEKKHDIIAFYYVFKLKREMVFYQNNCTETNRSHL